MKKLTKTKLAVRRETVRALDHAVLEHVNGGRSGLLCPTIESCPGSYSLCGNKSRAPGC